MDNKKVGDVVSSLKEKVKENSERLEQLQERVEKLENPGAHENRVLDDTGNLSNYAENILLDVSDILSNYAQKAAQDSKGPLKSDELLTHFKSTDFGKKKKEAMVVIRKFPDNIDGVKNQLSYILKDLETQVECRKKENELDIKLTQRIRKFNGTLEKEQEKRKKSNTKIKVGSNTDQSQNETTRNKQKVLGAKKAGKKHAGKQGKPVKQEERRGRKRKSTNYHDEDDDTCSSQEVEVEAVTASCKRLKLNSRTSSQESMQIDLVQEPGTYRQPRPVIDSGSSQSSLEEDSTEIFKTTKTDVKSTGKRSKQSECKGNEETVHEKQFSLRGKQIRRD